TDDTRKFASDVAKDVTQKAVTKVTQRVTQSQTTKIIETFEEAEDQSFDNRSGPGHISGVYQWVEKVYLAQVFNLGRHLLLDIMVPEPGASLLAAASIAPADQKLPVPPDPLGTFTTDMNGVQQFRPLLPSALTDDPNHQSFFYGDWVAKFQVSGV